MDFYKETIMGQVLTQVQADEKNKIYLDKIEDLLFDIDNLAYIDTNTKPWNKHGLTITENKVNSISGWIYVETADVIEYSWLVKQLIQIYKPNTKNIYRLLTTIGFLLNVYGEKYNDLSVILRFVSITSTVFLHPDHLGLDRFTVQPIKLPKFGTEF